MRIIKLVRRAGLGLIVASLLLLAFGCMASNSTLTARLTAANLLAATAAQGLISATKAQAIEPGSETTMVITQTLDAIELSLDSAGAALRAGLVDMAAGNLAAAETQLNMLQPLLPPMAGDQ